MNNGVFFIKIGVFSSRTGVRVYVEAFLREQVLSNRWKRASRMHGVGLN